MGPNPKKGHMDPSRTITPGPNAFAQRRTHENEPKKAPVNDEPKSSQDDGRHTGHSIDTEPKTSSSRSSKRASFWRDAASKFDFSQDRPRTPTSLGGGQDKKDKTPAKTTNTNRTPTTVQNKTPSKPPQHRGKKESPKATPKKRAPTPTHEPVHSAPRLGTPNRNDERIRKLVDDNDAVTPSKQSGKRKPRPTPPPLSLESIDRTPSRKGVQSPNPKSPKHRFRNMMGLGNIPNTKQNEQSGATEETEDKSNSMPRSVPHKAAQVLGTVSMGSRHKLPSPRIQPKFGALDLAGVPEFDESVFDDYFDERESVIVEDSGFAHPGNRVITREEISEPHLRALNERLESISSSNPQQGPDLSYMDGDVPPTPPSKKNSLKKDDTPRRSDSLKKRGAGKPFTREGATPRLHENFVHRRRNAVVEDNADIQSMHGSFHARPPMFGNTSHEPFNLRVPVGHQAHFEDDNNPFPTPPILGRQHEASEGGSPYSFSLHPDDSVTNYPSAYPSPLHPANRRNSVADSKDDENRDISDTSRSIPIMLDSPEVRRRIPGSAFPDFTPAEPPEQRSGDRRVPRAAFPHFGPIMASHNFDRPSYETMTMHSQPSESSLPPYAPPSGSVPGLATAKQAQFPEPQAESHPAFANKHPTFLDETNDEGTVRRSKKRQSPSHLTTESKLQELSSDYQNASTPERAHFQSLRDSLRFSATTNSRQPNDQGQQGSHLQEVRNKNPPALGESQKSSAEHSLTRQEALEFVRSHLVVVSREVFETLRLDPEAILLKLNADGSETDHGADQTQDNDQYGGKNRSDGDGSGEQAETAAAAGPSSSSSKTPRMGGNNNRQHKSKPDHDAGESADSSGEHLQPLMSAIKKEVNYISNKLQTEQLGISIPRLKNEEIMEVIRDSPFMRPPRGPSPDVQRQMVSLSRQSLKSKPSTQSSMGYSKPQGLAKNCEDDFDKNKASTNKDSKTNNENDSSPSGAEEGDTTIPYDKALGLRSLAEYYTEPHLTNLAEALTSLIWDNYGPTSQQHPFTKHPDLWTDSSIVHLVPSPGIVRQFKTPCSPIKSGTYAERAREMEEAMLSHQQEDIHARFAAGQLRQQHFLRMVLRAQHKHFGELAGKFEETQEQKHQVSKRELETWRDENVTAHIRDTVGKELKPTLTSSIEESLRAYNGALQSQLDRGLAAVEQRLIARVDQYLRFMTGMGGDGSGGAGGGWTGANFNGANSMGSGGLVTGSSTTGYSSSYGTSTPATANYISPTQMIMDDLRSAGSGGSGGTNNGGSAGLTGDGKGGSNSGRVGWSNNGDWGNSGGNVGWTGDANVGNNDSTAWSSGIQNNNSIGWTGVGNSGNVGWTRDTRNNMANNALTTAPSNPSYVFSGMQYAPPTTNYMHFPAAQPMRSEFRPMRSSSGNGTNNAGDRSWTGTGNSAKNDVRFGQAGVRFNGSQTIGYGKGNNPSPPGWTTNVNPTSTTTPVTAVAPSSGYTPSSSIPSTPATANYVPITTERPELNATANNSNPAEPPYHPQATAPRAFAPSTSATAILDDLQAGGGGGSGFGGFSASATPESAVDTRPASNVNTPASGNVENAAGSGPRSAGPNHELPGQTQHHAQQRGVGVGIRLPSATYRSSLGPGAATGSGAPIAAGRVWNRARQFDGGFGGGQGR